jgi:hypothetical protein
MRAGAGLSDGRYKADNVWLTVRQKRSQLGDRSHIARGFSMPNAALIPALMRALKVHEIGRNGDPYEISFAILGRSGASFGAMQGDLAKGGEFVRQTLRDVLRAQTVPDLEGIMRKLSVQLTSNPLSRDERARVDAALHTERAKVDVMDLRIAREVFDGLDDCIAAAQRGARSIDPRVQLYIAMWINMTGAPTTIKAWLGGSSERAPTPGNPVSVADIERYLRTTKYYTEHERNFRHLQESAEDGAALIPQLVDA